MDGMGGRKDNVLLSPQAFSYFHDWSVGTFVGAVNMFLHGSVSSF